MHPVPGRRDRAEPSSSERAAASPWLCRPRSLRTPGSGLQTLERDGRKRGHEMEELVLLCPTTSNPRPAEGSSRLPSSPSGPPPLLEAQWERAGTIGNNRSRAQSAACRAQPAAPAPPAADATDGAAGCRAADAAPLSATPPPFSFYLSLPLSPTPSSSDPPSSPVHSAQQTLCTRRTDRCNGASC